MGKTLSNNLSFRTYLKEKEVKYWEVAERIGINDGNFSRMLRHELPLEKLSELKNIVDDIVRTRGGI